jgi:hypothetical protein
VLVIEHDLDLIAEADRTQNHANINFMKGW